MIPVPMKKIILNLVVNLALMKNKPRIMMTIILTITTTTIMIIMGMENMITKTIITTTMANTLEIMDMIMIKMVIMTMMIITTPINQVQKKMNQLQKMNQVQNN